MKKVISLTLMLALLCSLLCVGVSADNATEAQLASFEGSLLNLRSNDYEGTETLWTTGTGVSTATIDGNNCAKLTYTSTGYINAGASISDMSLSAGTVARFDIMKKASGVPIFIQFIDSTLKAGKSVGFKESALTNVDEWYTVVASAKYVSNEVKVQLGVYDKATGACTYFTQTAENTVNGVDTATGVGLWYHSIYSSYLDSSIVTDNTEYYIDNVAILNYPQRTVSGLWMDYDFDVNEPLKGMLKGNTDGFVGFKSAEKIGGGYISIAMGSSKNYAYSRFSPISGANVDASSHVITLDVYKEAPSYSLHVYVSGAKNSTAKDGKFYVIPAYQCEQGKWYTYKIIRNGEEVTAYRKLKTEAEFTKIDAVEKSEQGTTQASVEGASTRVVYNDDYISENAIYDNEVMINLMNGADWWRLPDISVQSTGAGSSWRVDNLKVCAADAVAVSNWKQGIRRFTRLEAVTSDTEATELYTMVGYTAAADGTLADAEFSKTEFKTGEAQSDMFIRWTDSAPLKNMSDGLSAIKAFVWKDGLAPLSSPIDIKANY